MIIHGIRPKRANRIGDKYVGNVDEQTRLAIDDIYKAGKVESLKNVLNGYTLDDFQTMLPAIAYLSKRFLIGADTGLGKSLMISLYLLIHKGKGTLNETNKALVVTTNSSLNQIKSTIENSTGLKVKYLPGDEVQLMKVLSSKDIHLYDIYIVSNSVFGKSIEFNRIMAYMGHLINTFILDESMSVANKGSLTHNSIKYWLSNCEYRLFLNATVIEKSLDQLTNQFELVEEDLLPNLTFLKEVHEVYKRTRSGRGRKVNKQFMGYKDIDKLLASIPYHYANISRHERGLTFEYEDILVPLVATPKQKEIETPQNYIYTLFSPTTQEETKVIPFNRENVPALNKTIDIVREEYSKRGGGIVIYAEPVACKEVLLKNIKNEIPGISVGIIDGQSVDRDYTRQAFNRREIHVLIINIPEALDLTSGEVMIMYTIPSKHYQARARIARGLNNNGSPKIYYYPVYLNSYQSKYIQNTLRQDEETLDNAQKRGIITARKLSEKLRKLESNIVEGVRF